MMMNIEKKKGIETAIEIVANTNLTTFTKTTFDRSVVEGVRYLILEDLRRALLEEES